MPELAAHLERVAKELVQQLDDEQLVYWSMNEYGPSGIDGARNKAIEVVAAALAACAREEARWWADGMHAAGGGEICKFCERIESLERAVGEKA